jgi:spore maturation protein CgeB
MRIVFFSHSLISDWNHGNAHFLRGIVTELLHTGHQVAVHEPIGGWSLMNLLDEHGDHARLAFHDAYPLLQSEFYEPEFLDLDRALDGADLVIVHEWNDHDVVARIGEYRRKSQGFKLLFHDTHHRSISEPAQMADYDLRHYDGVLAFGEVIKDIYLQQGWANEVWTWHEAADVRVFKPMALYPANQPGPNQSNHDQPNHDQPVQKELVWIGNWGDDERTDELDTFVFEPIEQLGLTATVHGVRYPDDAVAKLGRAGIDYRGWLPNFEVPETFARHRFTVHVPRQHYVTSLPGIPTIRPFEAMACGIPLVCSPWEDAEGLFNRGKDHLVAEDGEQMKEIIDALLHDDEMVDELSQNGRETILAGHTCAHRVQELMGICQEMGMSPDLAPKAAQRLSN